MTCEVKLLKHGKGKKGSHKPSKATAKVDAVSDSFGLLDNEDGTFTVVGITAGKNEVDISDVATLTVVSSNTGVVDVDLHPVEGMTFTAHAVGPAGTADVTVTATWNDGSKGPFSFVAHGEVKAGTVTGIGVIFTGVTPH